MAKVFNSPQEAADALRAWDSAFYKMQAKEHNRGLYRIRERAVGGVAAGKGPVFMVRGSLDVQKDPPNPPPGPLKKRSRRLEFATRVVEGTFTATSHIEGRVETDDSQAPYGKWHESGTKRMRPRPYLTPAAAYEAPFILKDVEEGVERITERYFGKGF